MAKLAPTIVYDLDGTLADTAEDLVATLNWLLAREGRAPLKVENAGSLVGAGARALIARGFAASGKTLEPEKLEALFVDYLRYYSAHIVDRTRLYPGVDKALAAFERAGWRQAVCTNKTESLAKLLITELGIAERFRLHLRPGHVRGRQAGRRSRCSRPSPLQAARANARSWSGIPPPTSRPPAPPASR